MPAHSLVRTIAAITLALAGGGSGLAADTAPARPTPPALTCAEVPAHVRAPDSTQVAAACDGAREAMRFLADFGVLPGGPAHIELVDKLPSGMRDSAVGCYNHATDQISVLTYERFRERGTWFGVAIDRDLHRAVIAHETAHAVAGCLARSRELSLVAQEYVAYVTMFATMAPPLRARVLAGMPGTGFDREEQINVLMYAFDPMQFGADAWRHFERQPDRARFLRDVLEGRALQDPVSDALHGGR